MSGSFPLDGLVILRALLFAGECFLASLLLPVIAFAAALVLRRRAALRHLVWTTMFGTLAVLPLAAWLLPPRRIVEHVPAPAVFDAVAVPAPVAALPPSPTLPLGNLLTPENIVALLVGLWLAGLCWQILRLLVGGIGLVRLRRASAPFAPTLETGCEVRLASGEEGPSTFGILRPIVLLPRSAQAWPAARLEAVLRHEAAHVARRDTLSQLVARLVCAIFWPNPLLWLGLRALRRDAEIAADDQVLASGLTPSLYAAELVSLAAERQGVQPGIAMAGPPLAMRVQAVLAENSSRKGVTKMDIARTATLGLAATLMLGVARFDIAVAQDAPVAPEVSVTPAEPVAPQVEQNVDVERNVEARSEARAAAVRAKADAVAAKARAKAEAETDPARREQYRKQAEQVAAEAARVKASADRIKSEAKARLAEIKPRIAAIKAEALQRAEDVRREAELRIADARRERLAQADRLAQATPPSRGEASASADSDSSATTNGLTYTLRSRNGTGTPQNSNSNSNDGLANATPPRGADTAQSAMTQRYVTDKGPVRIDIQVDRAVADAMNRPEVRESIQNAVRTAMAEASSKISAAIAAARAKAGLPPAPPAPPEPN